MAKQRVQTLMGQFNLKEGSDGKWHGVTPKGKPYTMVMQNKAWQMVIPVTLKNSDETKQWKATFKKLQFNSNFSKSMLNLASSKSSHMMDRLGELLSLLDKNDFVLADICPLCEKGNCDSFGIVKGNFRPTHKNCINRFAQDGIEKLEMNEGNYISGAVGAFLGAFIITLIGLIPIMLIQASYGIIFACSGVSAVWGYKKLKGKLGAASRVIIVVASIAAFILFLYCYAYASLCMVLETTIPIDLLFTILPELTAAIFSVDFLVNCWFEILFFVGGLIFGCMNRTLSPKHVLAMINQDKQICQPIQQDNQLEKEMISKQA